ncbi:universal stress protein [Streptomyces sp. NPDC018693]|uniref:universal stress protein n=1 Tax=unclassified Streptomyces TaxID=2593676 RepID=UPI0037AD6ACD
MVKPVVVGVDGSPSSLAAVEAAAHEAALRGTGLRLVHAFGWPSIHVPPGGAPWNPATAGVRELVDGTLIEAEQRAREAEPGLDISREVTVGEPLMVLEIESRTASLVVVGSRGLGAFGSLLLGSTAVHLAAHGRCPVLVVRGRPGPSGPVMLALDGSPAGAAAVEFAFAEAALRGADLLAVHVWNTWTERAYEGPGDPLNVVVDIDRLREEEQRLLDDTLTPWQARYPGVTVERRLVRSRVRHALIEASSEAQLLVTGARGRGGFTGLLLGSVSQALLHHADCPVAVLRGFGGEDRPAGAAP